MTFETALRRVLEELAADVQVAQFDQLCAHRKLLDRWNRRINLTAIRDEKTIVKRHYGESVFLHRELPSVSSLVDVGSGGGFPGVPLAILRPSTEVVLVESKVRKAAFLREATRDLANVQVAGVRVSDWTGTADFAVMRAVAPARVLPDLRGRVDRVAILGTTRPETQDFGPWAGRRTPWSELGMLWISDGIARD